MADSVETYGTNLVGVNFNPSGALSVDIVKKQSAALIDYLENHREMAKNSAAKRSLSIAITDLEKACMMAVKGLIQYGENDEIPNRLDEAIE